MRKILVSLSLLLSACSVFAESRTAEQALSIARQFVGEMPIFSGIRQADFSLALAAAVGPQVAKGTKALAARPYYIYNVGERGFVIVSGDDRFSDVLGYSVSGHVTNEASLPDGLQYWLGVLAEEMNAADASGYRAMKSASRVIEAESVTPLLTTKWNQNAPYNDKLQGYMTGCVATAVAQVMKHWEYPISGTGEHQGAYSPYFSANFGAVRYDWKNMLDEYGTGWESKEEVDAVSTLMLHVGVATDMRWGKEQSGTPNNFAAYALHNYFGYNKNLYIESRDHMSYGAWKSLLINQLKTGHPLCYAGMSSKTGSSAGHFFVCDGYDDKSGMFHFNWGWSGVYDGYYALTALEPGTGGIGAGAGQFNYYQSVFVNVQPMECGEYQAHFDAVTVTPSGNSKSNIKVTTTGLTNNNTYNFAGSLGLSVCHTDGTPYKYIASATTLPLTGFSIGASYSVEFSYDVDASELADGVYTICAAAWSDRDLKAFPLRANYTNTTYYTMEVKGGNVSFSPISTQPSLTLSSMELDVTSNNKVYQNVIVHFLLEVTNNSALEFNDELGIQFEQSRSKKGMISVPVVIAPGETKNVDVYGIIPSTVNLGNATAKAVYGYDGTYSPFGSTISVTVCDESEASVGAVPSDTNQSSTPYNLAGQRAAKHEKGIIIKNGKKYLK